MPRSAPAASPPSPPPRRALQAALALALAGLVVAILLVRLHAQAHAGISSFCAVNETVNCDKVAMSPYSVVLRLPVAVWGAIGYGLAVVLAAWALFGPRPHPRWPVGLLFALAAAAVAASVALAFVSKVLIGAWCLLCIASWLCALGLFAASLLACRPRGVLASLRDDLATVRGAPRSSAGLAIAGVAGLSLLAAAYPRYWDKPPEAAAPAGAPAYAGPAVVVSYSDYECPYCARSHAEVRELLKRRPDLTLVKRHFPLDQSCNPLLKRPMHERACALARAAICAEAQGQLGPMDDALFENQKSRVDVEALAGQLGLDVPRFTACLAAPETAQRLAADIAAGLQAGVKATPSFVVRGVTYSGEFPLAVLPPPPVAPPPAPAP
jgi:protein-disulfide isomerase